MKFHKTILPFIVLAVLLNSCSKNYDFSKKFSVLPDKPQANTEMTVLFNPSGTAMEHATEINMIIYEYGKDLYSTEEYPMTKEDKGWVGKFDCADSTLGFMVKFSANDKFDNNGGKGYIQLLYSKDGKVLPGALAGLASAYVGWVDYLELDRNPEEALKLYEEEFKTNPNLHADHLKGYIYSINYVIGEPGKEKILSLLSALENKKDLTEKDIAVLINWNNRVGDPAKAVEFMKIMAEKFPKSETIQNEKYGLFYNAASIDEKIAAAESFIKEFEGEEYAKYMKSALISLLGSQNQFPKAYEAIEKFGKSVPSEVYNSLAYAMFENNVDLEKASNFAKMGVDAARKEIANPTEKKPKELASSEWKKQNQINLAYALDTYGQILARLNKNDEALSSMKEAIELTKGKEADLAKNYINMLVTLGKSKDAKAQIETLISAGNASSEMKEALKQIYIKEKGSEDGFDKYVGKFESEADAKMKEELNEKLLNESAPQISLSNINGVKISSSDLKGKVVILDFWATWCGPCKASFPAMKKVVEKYASNDKVKIYFVNTFERVEDKLKNAKDFIAQNNYPFDVLMDVDNAVSKSFKVTGIPTKVILDGAGNIRFKSVGYGGNDEVLIKELDMMIEMIK
ncbi:MAG: redoxin domain-containing protein [bacterium]